jgi:hypothetical protein
MALYRVVSVHQAATGGFETTIHGPGIPTEGVIYWFESRDEPHFFVENLNLLYAASKQLAKWRLTRPRKRRSASPRSTAHAARAASAHGLSSISH